jgi:hypothetical protein
MMKSHQSSFLSKVLIFIALLFGGSSFFNLYGQTDLRLLGARLVDQPTTVPTGQVWKVEAILYSSQPVTATSTSGTSQTSSDYISVNNQSKLIRISSTALTTAGAATTTLWEQSMPLWLPAGTAIGPGTGVRFINVLCFLAQ